MENVIELNKIDSKDGPTAWIALSDICKEKGYKVNTLHKKKFPFNHDGHSFVKKRVKAVETHVVLEDGSRLKVNRVKK